MLQEIDSEDLFFPEQELASVPLRLRRLGETPRRPRGRQYRRFTDELVKALPVQAREYFVFDAISKCLAVRIRDGIKTHYYYPSGKGDGEFRKKALGSCEHLTVEHARALVDKIEDVRLNGVEAAPRLKELILREAVEQYACFGAVTSTAAFQRLLSEHLLGQLASRPLSSIKRWEIARAIDRVAARNVRQADFFQKGLKALFNRLVDRNLMDSNPIARRAAPSLNDEFRGNGSRRSRYQRHMPAEDIALIYFAAREMKEPWRTMIAFTILTGAQISTVRDLQASRVDSVAGLFASASEAPHPHLWEPLGDLALQVLNEGGVSSNGRYFPSPRKACENGVHLRPSVLAALQECSGTRGWKWFDLVSSVRSHMRGINVALFRTTGDDETLERRAARARANLWAQSLPVQFDKARARRASADEVVI